MHKELMSISTRYFHHVFSFIFYLYAVGVNLASISDPLVDPPLQVYLLEQARRIQSGDVIQHYSSASIRYKESMWSPVRELVRFLARAQVHV